MILLLVFQDDYIEIIESFDEHLIFTSHLHAIYKHMTKFRDLCKSTIDGEIPFQQLGARIINMNKLIANTNIPVLLYI